MTHVCGGGNVQLGEVCLAPGFAGHPAEGFEHARDAMKMASAALSLSVNPYPFNEAESGLSASPKAQVVEPCAKLYMSLRPRPPLPRLREIREAQKAALELTCERDELVRQALDEGHSERSVAVASGLSPSRVHEISAR